ncbi:hypothetical protein [Paractinoplanes ferrugineus]|uniref:hypothetical protein n=1 Tax=Paractinoplanes ferrugineus TaxID=113564 RepID=UPI00194526E4|nr:hypothetical protein [Actinoplanes ferrugineus]
MSTFPPRFPSSAGEILFDAGAENGDLILVGSVTVEVARTSSAVTAEEVRLTAAPTGSSAR